MSARRTGSRGKGPRWLAPDERIELRTRPHWKWLFRPILVFLLASAALGVALYFVDERTSGSANTAATIAAAAVYAVLVALFCVVRFIDWLTTNFFVTNKRVAYRHGVFTRTGVDIPLSRIASVEFRHGLLDRVLRTGVLVVESASDEPLEFEDIPHVEQVHAMLYREVFDLDGHSGRA
ncbi:membrane-flanked domain protein [Segniliparus rotundus DSM 44985]|uniref:Membrane-flanked domain protein n=1 Tax=Segniliparus rotundus (strain ATCC BAA-972 / CDC 1076 / CIP 108378 / DSM 44985 / JCM 13578) TaxID=640132 RepID=D6ZED0_SEGRD|nr:PH domain-containing protein [Segniliparus rotundus]ADG99406.1 membrane-flanked domain protein [Segniliparus rotundus DSM 44985]